MPEPLAAVLERVLKAPDKKLDPEIDRIFSVWDQCVGMDIAEEAQPDSYKNGMLMVKVSSAPWSQQLEFEKIMIMDRLNQALGKRLVSGIRFKTGTVRRKSKS